jgi:hypothetical protein
MSKTWKAAESRIGAWLGAKGIGKSGRLPLSGGNSGVSRADSPHPTIFNECKRDRSYHVVIKQWLKCKEACPDTEVPVIDLGDDVIVFHSEDAQRLVEGCNVSLINYLPSMPPRALTLFKNTVKVKEESLLDKNKKVVCVCLVYHHHRGFWVVMYRKDIKLWWECVLAARIDRERLLAEDEARKGLASS